MFWKTKHNNFSLIFYYQTVSEQKNIFPKVYSLKPYSEVMALLCSAVHHQIGFCWVSNISGQHKCKLHLCCPPYFYNEIVLDQWTFSGTRLPLRKSITMRWKSVGTTADVGGRRWDNGGRRWTSAGRRNSEVKEESGNSLHSLNRCGLVEC